MPQSQFPTDPLNDRGFVGVNLSDQMTLVLNARSISACAFLIREPAKRLFHFAQRRRPCFEHQIAIGFDRPHRL